MGHDHNGEVALELEEQLLDPLGALRVERRRRLVQQDDFGRRGDGTSQAEPLLLAAGQGHSAGLEPVLDLLPECRLAKSALDRVVELRSRDAPVEPEPRGHIVEHRHGGKRRRALKHHAHPPAQLHHVDPRGVDVFAVEQHPAGDPAVLRQLVHPVERAEKGGLAAPGRTDQRMHPVGRKGQGDTLHRGEFAVHRGELVGRYPGGALCPPGWRARGRIGARLGPTAHGGLNH
jgi:hypothetical protein